MESQPNEWVNSETKEEIKSYLKTNENEHTTVQNLQAWKRSPEKEDHSITGLLQEEISK